MRTITIYSTLNGVKKIQSDATNWGDLIETVKEEVSLDNMLPVLSTNRMALVASETELPEEDFTIFLRPIRTKSGIDKKELLDTIAKKLETYELTGFKIKNSKIKGVECEKIILNLALGVDSEPTTEQLEDKTLRDSYDTIDFTI